MLYVLLLIDVSGVVRLSASFVSLFVRLGGAVKGVVCGLAKVIATAKVVDLRGSGCGEICIAHACMHFDNCIMSHSLGFLSFELISLVGCCSHCCC